MHLDRLAVITILDRHLWRGTDIVGPLAHAQRLLSDLTEPALLPYERVGQFQGQLYLVRSHVVGHVLADLIHMLGLLESRQATLIAANICDALAPAHRAGLVHGSLSPSSVIVADDGQVTLLDTGLFPALYASSGASGQSWGRSPYGSPEQAAGQRALPASDVYAVGLILYEMLAGRAPFRPGDEAMVALQHMRYDPPLLEVLVPDVPETLAQIVHKSLAKEPSARYRNAGQLAHILRSQFNLVASAPAPQAAVAPPVQQAQMQVPPPPLPATDEELAGVSTEVDWLMVGLLIAALIAVLGLIPLWRVVYHRYALPPPAATPVSLTVSSMEASAIVSQHIEGQCQVLQGAKLDALHIVVYNSLVPKQLYAVTRDQGIGINSRVWESRLRCWGRSGIQFEGKV
jgi:serine/threonine-protein kinase